MRLSDERLLRVRILSHTGDKIHIKLPVGFVKKMIKNNTFDFFYGADDMIDSQKGALKTIMIIISWILLLGVIGSAIFLILRIAGVW